jgi:hypothetical protein
VTAVRRATTVAALLGALVWSAQPAGATAGDLGHDVSYLQCSKPLPTSGVFGIVGVTVSKPFSLNSCLASEAAWAAATGQPMLYTNTANPGPSSGNWSKQPVGRCTTVSTNNAGCAYEYGRKAAADALAKAVATVTAFDPKKVTWWLDVEGSRTAGQAGNSWTGTGVVNAADIQGFVDGLRAGGVPEVGVYSTGYQWNDITGGYTRTNSASYRKAWGFAGAYPIEDGPVWFAGVGTLDEAKSRCAGTSSFTGGQRLLAQYLSHEVNGDFDGDVRCADPDKVAPTASLTAPTSRVTQAYSFGAAWSGADSGGSGLATFDVATKRVASNGTAFSGWSYPYLRSTTRSASLSATGQGWTTCVTARSRDAAGNVSPWVPTRCTAVPLDDRLLAAGSGWTRASASGWFLSSYSVTTRQYATLVRTGLVTSRLYLIAQRCSTCGKVGVYLGGTLLTTVDLRASSSYRAVIALPRFSLRTTKVTLKVLTSGKPVRIDGLVSSRV